MNAAMKQMEDSMELMNQSMRQMHFLHQRIEALEASRQPSSQFTPAVSMTLSSIRDQTDTIPSNGNSTVPAMSNPDDGNAATFLVPRLENEGPEDEWSQPNDELEVELSSLQWPS